MPEKDLHGFLFLEKCVKIDLKSRKNVLALI